MLRNPFGLLQQEMRRVAAQATRTQAQAAAPSYDAGRVQIVGGNDATSGDWQPAGLLDITRLGEGFRLV